MAHSILSVLSRPNPVLDRSGLSSGGNHESGEVLIETWNPWTEFNFKDLHARFKDVVKSAWRNPPTISPISGINSRIIDEETFEHQVLSTDIIPTVNAALQHVRSIRKRQTRQPAPEFALVRGSWCTYENDNRYHADWALVNPEWVDNVARPVCLTIGETKISSKWNNEFDVPADSTEYEMWLRPVQQVVSYADKARTSYGFIITDKKLTVMVFRKEEIDDGLATNRNSRVHARTSSVESQLSSSVAAMSLGSTYVDDQDSLSMHVAYCDIPWEAHGPKTLTIKLGLFFLCMLAVCGDLEPLSPEWARHPNELLELEAEADSGAAEGDSDETGEETETGEGGETTLERGKQPQTVLEDDNLEDGTHLITDGAGSSHWTSLGVETLRFDPAQGLYFFVQAGVINYIPDCPVYDEETEEWGTFQGGVWVPATTTTAGDSTASDRRSARAGSSSKGSSSKRQRRHR